MTEQEKAISLVEEFYQHTNTNSRESAKACARILAKEVILKLKYTKVMNSYRFMASAWLTLSTKPMNRHANRPNTSRWQATERSGTKAGKL